MEGNAAECDWKVTHDDDTKSGPRSGKIKITLAGDTIKGTSEEDEPPAWAYKPGFNKDNVTSSMHKGRTYDVNLKR